MLGAVAGVEVVDELLAVDRVEPRQGGLQTVLVAVYIDSSIWRNWWSKVSSRRPAPTSTSPAPSQSSPRKRRSNSAMKARRARTSSACRANGAGVRMASSLVKSRLSSVRSMELALVKLSVAPFGSRRTGTTTSRPLFTSRTACWYSSWIHDVLPRRPVIRSADSSVSNST